MIGAATAWGAGTVGALLMIARDVPEGDGWLSPAERAVAAGLSFERRRHSWRLGRCAAKRAVAARFGLSEAESVLRGIEIRAAGDGAPELFVAGRRSELAISLSHREDLGLCAVAEGAGAVGCDVEIVEPRSEAMIADFYTAAECARVLGSAGAQRDLLAALVWSAKESALKVVREGLRRDTRSVELEEGEAVAGEWRRLAVRCRRTGRLLPGWARRAGRVVLTVVSEVATSPPLDLTVAGGNGLRGAFRDAWTLDVTDEGPVP